MISYEFEYAIVDEFGDIIHLEFQTTHRIPEPDETLAIVKNYGDDIHGIKDRAYAYIGDKEFDDGTKVPKKFLKYLR